MPDIFTVGATTAIPIKADSVDQKQILNARGGTIYYKNASDVSTSSNDGNLTAGQSVTITGTTWIISSATPTVTIVNPTPASPAFTDITASDDVTISDTLTVTGATTVTGGIAQATAPHGFPTWQPVAATSGTDTAFASGTLFVGSVFVPVNKTLTGIGFLVGSVGGTDKVVVQLNSASGALLANSTLTASGTTAGTAAQTQEIAFTSTYAAKGPAIYYIGVSANGNTAKLRTVPAYTSAGIFAGSVSQTAATPAAITAPTTFTADKAPVAYVY